MNGEAEVVNEEEIANAHSLFVKSGFYVEPSSGGII